MVIVNGENILKFYQRDLFKDKIGIYAIINLVNNMVYIGQTGQSFNRRFLLHNWKLKNNCHDNKYLQNAFNKYGNENFVFKVLEVVQDKSLLNELEIKYIQKYKNINKSYNLSLGGDGKRGFSMSESAKRIVGDKNRQHMLGKKHSVETRQKMSISRTGKHYTIYRETTVLTDEKAKRAKILLMEGKSCSEVAKILDVSSHCVNGILSGNTWKHIFVEGWEDFQHSRNKSYRMSEQTRIEIYEKYLAGKTRKQLSLEYDVDRKRIESLIRHYNKLQHDNPVPSLV